MQIDIINDENFAVVRQSLGYYVDKTGFFNEYLQSIGNPQAIRVPTRVSMFTRPRRFGKTMFMSMLAEFFDITKDSKAIFSGLKVSSNENLCKIWMNQYPVVFITLKSIKDTDWESAFDSIKDLFGNTLDLHRYVLDSDKISPRDKMIFQSHLDNTSNKAQLQSSLLLLTKVLYQYYGRQVILLIDEYDAPLAASVAAKHSYYDEMLPFMRNLLGNALKTNPYILIGILTGVLRLSKQSLFSDINHLECYDIDAQAYEDLFGFTQEEVDAMLACAGILEKREIIKEWYDGYHIGRRSDIYCPWSVTQYLRALSKSPTAPPQDYWVDTGSNQPTKEFAPRLPSATVQEYMTALLDGKTIPAQINTKLNYDRVFLNANNFWTLLYMHGYLTTSDDRENCVDKPGLMTVLGIPNKEVKKVFETEISSMFEDVLPDDCREEFLNLFWQGDAEGLEQLLNERLKLSISILEYTYKEIFYQTLLKGFFLLQYNIYANREAGEGIFDLMVDNGKDVACVIEVKRADTESQLEAKVQEALAQIEDRSYDAPLRAKNFTKILHWGMAFYKKTCKMGVKIA